MNIVILASTPIILLIMLLILRKPLYIVAPITFTYTLIISIMTWMMKQEYITAAIMKAMLITIDIALIIFGAIIFLEYLKNTGLLKKIEEKITQISPDKRIQAIIIIWFFGSFIEGTAGFGTPAAITAPLLVAIGFPAILAVTLALIGNSTAVVFGAVGTPIRIGYSGLETAMVPQTAALINLIAGLTIPLIIIGVMTYYEKQPIQKFKEMIPYATWAGMCFLIPYYALSYLGPEFPSLLGPIIGLAIIIYTTKKNLFVPKPEIKKQQTKIKELKYLKPYAILIALLLIGKYVLPSKIITLQEGVTHNLTLYNPGLLFLATIIIMSITIKNSQEHIKNAIKNTKTIIIPTITIFFITAIVQLLILSSYNDKQIPGILTTISQTLITPNFIIISPILGLFGSFISGSATVSNILFGAFQYETAQIIGISTILVLALQAVGAGIGNMLSLTNIVAAQATVNLKHQETKILKKTIIPALIYLVITIIIGIILSRIM